MVNANLEQSFDILYPPSSNVTAAGILQPGDDVFPKLQNLPEECVREVLLRLADHKDLENSGKAYSVMQRLVDEQRIWRELCRFHFTPQQIGFVLQSCPPQTDWQGIYHKLRKWGQYFYLWYTVHFSFCRLCRCLPNLVLYLLVPPLSFIPADCL